MPKRKSKPKVSPHAIIVLVALALVLFVLGEAVLMLRTDRGQLFAARWLGRGDDARITQIVSRNVRLGLEAARVPGDSIRELPATDAAAEAAGKDPRSPRVRWRVGLPSGVSLLQTNFTLAQSLAKAGIEVISGRERVGRNDDPQVVLLVGWGGQATHEIVLSRMPVEEGDSAPTDARLALVIYGFGDDAALAGKFVPLAVPFALALPAGGKESPALFKSARDHGREVVLQLPLEPINYPQVDPGPGTILVTMKPAHIASLMRRYLDQAGPVAAVANHMGSLATQDMTVMAAIYRELHRQRVPFLHVSPAAGAVCKSLAGELGVSYAEPDELIEFEAKANQDEPLERRWKSVLAAARERGQLVVLIRATPRTLEFLPHALDPKRLKGVSVVPLASLLRRPSV